MGCNASTPVAKVPILAARLFSDLLDSAVLHELAGLSALPWVDHVNQRDYSGRWSVLPLRCLKAYRHAHPLLQGFAQEEEGEWQDLPALRDAPALTALLRRIACPLKSVRLMRLAAGAAIKPHRDPGLAWEYGEARLHLPVRTDPQVSFTVAGWRVPMNQGELWYLNADTEHAVVNASVEDRIHLVVDAEVNDWLQATILAAAPAADLIE